MTKKDYNKLKNNRPFYFKWWFWTIIIVLFTITWLFLLIDDNDLRTSVIGICGIWGSTIAAVFIGVIAYKQSKDYKEQNDMFVNEQKDMLWRESQYNYLERFSSQLTSFYNKLERFQLIKSEYLYGKIDDKKYIERYKTLYIMEFKEYRDNVRLFLKLSALSFDGTEEFIKLCDEFKEIIQKYASKEMDGNFVKVVTEKANKINEAMYKMLAEVEVTKTIVFCKDIALAKRRIEDVRKVHKKLLEEN